MDNDWDAEDFEPEVANLVAPPAVEEEIILPKDEETKPSKPSVTKPKKGKKEKEKDGESNEPRTPLTGKEAEELSKISELQMLADSFGTENGVSSQIGTYTGIETLDQFKTFADELGKMLLTRSNNAHYSDFLKQLFLNACDNVDSKHVRMLSTTLKAKADALAEAEKKRTKVTAKPTIKPAITKGGGGRRAGDFDDYGGDGGYEDGEDFM